MLSLVAGTAVLGLGLLLIAASKRNGNLDLDQIPTAHVTVPFSRLWLVWIRWRSVEHRTRISLHRRLGPVVRIAPREVSVNCVDDGIRTIYGGNFEKDPRFYRAFVDDVPYMFTMLGTDEHKRRKKMLAQVYSKSNILTSPVLDEIISRVLGGLQEGIARCESAGVPINVLEWNKACMLDVITGWLYGTDNSTDTVRDASSRIEFLTSFETRFEGLFWRWEAGWLLNLLRRLGIETSSKSARDADDTLKRWIRRMNAKAYNTHGNNSSLAANVCAHLYDNLKEASPDMSHEEIDAIIAAELDDHLAAGKEATGFSLTYAMYELSRHPEAQRTLRKELQGLAETGEQSRAQRIDELPMLDAVVTETFRVHSTNPGPWPRIVPEAGCRIAGRFDLPAGTVVSASPWTLHRNPVLFSSPEDWRPERWLEADETTRREMRRWIWTFGSGARMCIGNHLAIRLFKEVLVALYSRYSTVVSAGFTGNMDQMDALMAGPMAQRLDLTFERLP